METTHRESEASRKYKKDMKKIFFFLYERECLFWGGGGGGGCQRESN